VTTYLVLKFYTQKFVKNNSLSLLYVAGDMERHTHIPPANLGIMLRDFQAF